MAEAPHRYMVTEPEHAPLEGLALGWLAMVPIVVGAAGVWLLSGPLAAEDLRLTLLWSGAVVTFLSGVRRGLSFRAPQGPTAPQIITFLWLFAAGFAGLIAAPGVAATCVLILGYLSLAVFDTLAARKEEAPPYFARLRPPQMGVAILALVATLAWQLKFA